MERRSILAIITLFAVLILAACGPARRPPATAAPAGSIPERIGETGWVRVPGLEHFKGDSLFEYINGAAEMYHKYDFIEVTAARYLKDEGAITAELYLFEGSDRAFGMYTTLRPDEPDTVFLGAEGFAFGPNLVFVKGSHLVNVYTYDDFEGTIPAVRSVASAIDGRLPGSAEKPEMFGRFPDSDRVAFSEKIFAEGFLGYGFLTDVYTVDYSIDGERIRLFITPDPVADKFDRWLAVAESTPDAVPGWMGEIFEESKSLQIIHDYHGEIVAGWRGGKLVGMVGDVPAYRGALVNWVRSLK